MLPGEIYWAYLFGNQRHPVVVVSREALNRGDYFVGVPLTSQRIDIRKTLPNCVYFPKGAHGLPKECVAQAEAMSQMRKSQLVRSDGPIGKLSESTLAALISAIGNVIGADCFPATAEASTSTDNGPCLDD